MRIYIPMFNSQPYTYVYTHTNIYIYSHQHVSTQVHYIELSLYTTIATSIVSQFLLVLLLLVDVTSLSLLFSVCRDFVCFTEVLKFEIRVSIFSLFINGCCRNILKLEYPKVRGRLLHAIYDEKYLLIN